MAASSSRSMPRSSAAKVTARYMAPVSSLLKPSWRAISLAMVDLPEPAGPSMATIMQCFLSVVDVLEWYAGATAWRTG